MSDWTSELETSKALAMLRAFASVGAGAFDLTVTDTQTGTDYIVRELKLPAANAKTEGRVLFGIVYEEIHK